MPWRPMFRSTATPGTMALLMGDFEICQANECKAARAWWAVRENGDRAPLDPMDWI